MNSVFCGNLKITIFGESHGESVGAIVEGLPSDEAVDPAELQTFLNRRAPGKSWSSARREADIPEFLSGLTSGRTDGTPLRVILRNTDAHSGDYPDRMDVPRPGHADFSAWSKYGDAVDLRGGGHFSGRLTAPLCVAGGVCKQILARRGVRIGAHLLRVGSAAEPPFDPLNPLCRPLREDFPTRDDPAAMLAEIENARIRGDSVDGDIECAAVGVCAGLGNPMFDGMENRVARLAFAIPAVKAIQFGEPMRFGSDNNDAFYMDGSAVRTRTNHCGGILGGITNGMPIIFRMRVKPTPSIAIQQSSISLSKRLDTEIRVNGRHDSCIAPRAVPCAEAVLAIAILDAMLEENGKWMN